MWEILYKYGIIILGIVVIALYLFVCISMMKFRIYDFGDLYHLAA